MTTPRIAALLAICAAFAACSTEPVTTESRAILARSADNGLSRFEDADPTLRPQLDAAAGYAIIPEIKKLGMGVGGAYGKGELYEHGTKTGYCDVSIATVGLQLGVQAYSELIVFKDPAAIEKFKAGQFAFAANASAAVIKAGAAGAAEYRDGVAVFLLSKGGLMAEASVGGQTFTYVPIAAAAELK